MADLFLAGWDPIEEVVMLEQSPVSRRRLARDIAEMVNEPYLNTRLIPSQHSIVEACLLLNTGTRIVHVTLRFLSNYPAGPTLLKINTRAGEGSYGIVRCVDVLADVFLEKQAYTIKTLAMHLLSMFDGDCELAEIHGGKEFWIKSKWKDFSCDKCAYPMVDSDAINTNADNCSTSQTIIPHGQSQSKAIKNIPIELLKKVLEYLEIQDIVRFGQAWDKIEGIIEEHVIIRDRELRCFVTKEHFTQSPLGIGFYSAGWRWAEFDLISLAAFRDLRVRTTAYDCQFEYWLPLPLCEWHWENVKDKVNSVLLQVSRPSYEVDCFDVLIAFMEDQAIKLFTSKEERAGTGLLQASEKGIESLSFLSHLLVCIAVDKSEYVNKANDMIESFQADNAPLKDMPSPGRILAALLISDVETNIHFLPRLFGEAVTHNVPQLLEKYPGLGYQEDDGAASSYRLHQTFMAGLASYRALMLMNIFQRTFRPATNGTTLEKARDTLFNRRGFPPSSTLAILVAELPRIMAVDSFPRLCNHLGIYRNRDQRWLAGRLRQAVLDATIDRGLVSWTLSQDESLVLRHEAERESGSPLLWTEDLPPCPVQPTFLEVVRKLGPSSPLFQTRRGMIAALP